MTRAPVGGLASGRDAPRPPGAPEGRKKRSEPGNGRGSAPERNAVTVFDLLTFPHDIDVCDNVIDDLYPALCTPCILTAEGFAHFAPVLSLPVEIHESTLYGSPYYVAEITLPDDWKPARRRCKEFFRASAGYCTEAEYDRYFLPDDRYFYRVQTGDAVSLADVFREWLEHREDLDFSGALALMLTPWEECLEEIELEPELGEPGSYREELGANMLELIRSSELDKLDFMQELVDKLGDWELEHELEKQIELRRYLLTH